MSDALYGFAYSSQALAFLKGLPKKIRRQIIAKVQALARDPYPPTCKMLQGMRDGEESVYRVRSGDYRILYVVRKVVVIILDIGHRKDIYR
jgi:mRNA interferase RelE/StbE